MLSTNSLREPWVNFEAGGAWLAGKVVIPICFGGVSKENLPKPYSNLQALNLRDDYIYLVTSLRHHLPMDLTSRRLASKEFGKFDPDRTAVQLKLLKAIDDYDKQQ
jgi:hypothetical protein